MSIKIPIKIGDNSQVNHHDIKKALNLNQVLSQASSKMKNKGKPWMILSLILTLALAALVFAFFWSAPKNFSLYQNLIPPETKITAFLKIDQLENISSLVLPELEKDSSFYRWLKERTLGFLRDSGVSGQEIASLLEKDIVFLVLPSEENLNWLIIGKLKPASSEKQILFGKIEYGLRQDFGLDQSFYRQIKINSVYSFGKTDRPYYYAEVNNFIIIGNSLDSVRDLIGKIIGK